MGRLVLFIFSTTYWSYALRFVDPQSATACRMVAMLAIIIGIPLVIFKLDKGISYEEHATRA